MITLLVEQYVCVSVNVLMNKSIWIVNRIGPAVIDVNPVVEGL